MANTKPGAWAMRGPQNKLHFYTLLRNGIDLTVSAICGASDPSFAYSVTTTPEIGKCCGRCLKQRGGQP
jgi:hypothetical protein